MAEDTAAARPVRAISQPAARPSFAAAAVAGLVIDQSASRPARSSPGFSAAAPSASNRAAPDCST